MPTNIFVNLPVADLQRSIDFFTKLGYSFNPQFTDEHATCMIISDTIYAMLLTQDRFASFITTKNVANAATSTEAILALSADSREAVDALVDTALASGGSPLRDPEDHGFMYARSFQDPDGHIWETFWMDPSHIEAQENGLK